MAMLLKEPPVMQPPPVAESPHAAGPAHPVFAVTSSPERFSMHEAVAAMLLACGEWGALAHGALWYALLHGLFRRGPA